MKATYIALTSTGQEWEYLCRGENREKVQAQGRELCGDSHPVINVSHRGMEGTYTTTGIYAQTRNRNLRVVTKTDAKRKFVIDIDRLVDYDTEW